MNLHDAQREYDAAMENMKQATLRLNRAVDALAEAHRGFPRPQRGTTTFGNLNVPGAHFGNGNIINYASVRPGEVVIDGQTYTGSVSIDSTGTHVSGKIIRDGNPRRCVVCQGTRGWTIKNDETWHHCGAQQ
jgi:hypothetical protein